MADPITLAVLGGLGYLGVSEVLDKGDGPAPVEPGAATQAGGGTVTRSGTVISSRYVLERATSTARPVPTVVSPRRVYEPIATTTPLDVGYAVEDKLRAAYASASAEAKANGAKAVNNALGKDVLDGTESFDEAAKKIGAAAGAGAGIAACAVTGVGSAASGFCGAAGAWIGGWAGENIGKYLGDAYDDVKDWAEGLVSDAGEWLEDKWGDLGDSIGLW